MQNNEQKAGTAAEKRTAVDSIPSASLVQNGMLAEAKFRPILFSTEMVKAILEGRKTMTRRKIKNKDQPYLVNEKSFINYSNSFGWNVKHKIQDNPERFEITQQFKCPYGKIDDILWVRETWRKNDSQTGWPYHYYEDDFVYTNKDNEKWKPSIFMPKMACRIFLKITDIRVELLQDISEEDAVKEGVESCYPSQICSLSYKDYLENPDDEFEWFSKAKYSFQSLWQKINGQKSWEANPFVWVVSFELADCPPGFC